MARLLPQVDRAGSTEVIGFYNHGEYRVPLIRQRLLQAAKGTFLSFIDDDDMVSDDYVESIHDEVLVDPSVDSVGFNVWLEAHHGNQVSICSREQTAAMAGRTDCGPNDGMAYQQVIEGGVLYESWGIMTPTRSVIAQRCRFDTYAGRVGEDGWFRLQLMPLLGPEAYIPRILYTYQWDPDDSSQTGWHRKGRSRPPRMEIDSPSFRWHPWSAR
jgi:hypothetical protein